MRYKITALIMLPLLALPAYNKYQQYYYAHTLGKSVVRLLGHGGGGTGFEVKFKGKQYTLTNDHVCGLAEEGRLLVVSSFATVQMIRIVAHSPLTDLCLLEPVRELPALEFAPEELRRGDKIVVLGHPRLRPIEAHFGKNVKSHVIDVMVGIITNKEEMDACSLPKNRRIPILFGLLTACTIHLRSQSTTARIEPGNSGSPVLDLRGKVRGVAFASGPNGLADIIPFTEMMQFMRHAAR